MQTYTENAANKSPKQKVVEQLEQFSSALAECRPLFRERPDVQMILELLEEGTGELKATIEREWVAQ